MHREDLLSSGMGGEILERRNGIGRGSEYGILLEVDENIFVNLLPKLGVEDCPYTFFSLVILELPYIGPRGKWVSNQLPPAPDGQPWHAIYWAIPKPRHSPQF